MNLSIESITEALKLERIKRNLTQSELADLADIKQSTICNIESGKNFSIKNYIKLKNYFKDNQ